MICDTTTANLVAINYDVSGVGWRGVGPRADTENSPYLTILVVAVAVGGGGGGGGLARPSRSGPGWRWRWRWRWRWSPRLLPPPTSWDLTANMRTNGGDSDRSCSPAHLREHRPRPGDVAVYRI